MLSPLLFLLCSISPLPFSLHSEEYTQFLQKMNYYYCPLLTHFYSYRRGVMYTLVKDQINVHLKPFPSLKCTALQCTTM